MSNPALDVFWRLFKENGMKRTPQRTAIFLELLKTKDHPTADAVYKRIVKKIPNISFDTVNRTLSTFSKIGVIKVVEGYGEPKRYDPDLGLHHHFRCIRCGRITDFRDKDYDTIAVPGEISSRFTVTSKKVVLEGFCGQCGKEAHS